MSKLLSCPICHVVPELLYACGDYFVYCSDGCPAPMCDHPSEDTTVHSWNEFVLKNGIYSGKQGSEISRLKVKT